MRKRNAESRHYGGGGDVRKGWGPNHHIWEKIGINSFGIFKEYYFFHSQITVWSRWEYIGTQAERRWWIWLQLAETFSLMRLRDIEVYHANLGYIRSDTTSPVYNTVLITLALAQKISFEEKPKPSIFTIADCDKGKPLSYPSTSNWIRRKFCLHRTRCVKRIPDTHRVPCAIVISRTG